MVLPESKLTIYDYLIVSLTNRDCIATFNWDPLLMQAYHRMSRITENLPEMLTCMAMLQLDYAKDAKICSLQTKNALHVVSPLKCHLCFTC